MYAITGITGQIGSVIGNTLLAAAVSCVDIGAILTMHAP